MKKPHDSVETWIHIVGTVLLIMALALLTFGLTEPPSDTGPSPRPLYSDEP